MRTGSTQACVTVRLNDGSHDLSDEQGSTKISVIMRRMLQPVGCFKLFQRGSEVIGQGSQKGSSRQIRENAVHRGKNKLRRVEKLSAKAEVLAEIFVPDSETIFYITDDGMSNKREMAPDLVSLSGDQVYLQ